MSEIEKLKAILKHLKSIDLSHFSFEEVCNLLTEKVKMIPMTIAEVSQGTGIYRGRPNTIGKNFFNSEKEISYRTNHDEIINYGRVNIPHQSMFYGAIPSQTLPYGRVINLFEISEILRKKDKRSNGVFHFTFGKWKVIKAFKVVEIVFCKDIFDKNPELVVSFEHHYKNIKNEEPQKLKQIELVLEFFCSEFTKSKINSHHDYKISSAYSNLILGNKKHQNLSGVLYPSVRTDYKANNIALSPDAVDEFLKLEMVLREDVIINGNSITSKGTDICIDLGENHSNFKWVDIRGKNEDEISSLILKNKNRLKERKK